MKTAFLLIALAGMLHGGEISYELEATRDTESLALANDGLIARLFGGTKEEKIVFRLRSEPGEMGRDGVFGHWGAESKELGIEWLDTDGEVKDYRRSLNFGKGIHTITYVRGGTGFTERVFVSAVDDLLVVHLQVDKPGALGFHVKLKGGEVMGSREIVVDDGVLSARVWVYPMESEVDAEKSSLLVRGEGEALIFLAAGEAGSDLSGKLDLLGFKDGKVPDLAKVLMGLESRHLDAHRKMMGEVTKVTPDNPSKDSGSRDVAPRVARILIEEYYRSLGMDLKLTPSPVESDREE